MHLSGAVEQLGSIKMNNVFNIGLITFWGHGILVYIMFFSIL